MKRLENCNFHYEIFTFVSDPDDFQLSTQSRPVGHERESLNEMKFITIKFYLSNKLSWSVNEMSYGRV